jgi:hypothetical protein
MVCSSPPGARRAGGRMSDFGDDAEMVQASRQNVKGKLRSARVPPAVFSDAVRNLWTGGTPHILASVDSRRF